MPLKNMADTIKRNEKVGNAKEILKNSKLNANFHLCK